MPPTKQPFNAPSSTELRAALLRSLQAPAPPTHPLAAAPLAAIPAPAALPTAPELLAASPAIQRLCESYHRIHRHLVARSRRQRLGIAALVAAVGIGAIVLDHSNQIAPSTLSNMVLAVAAMSCVSLGLLAALWVRDDNRLRDAQGDRLLRALQFSNGLPDERLSAFRRLSQPTVAFFDCYNIWRSDHPDQATGLQGLLESVINARRRATT
jgi:hypothetical protein